ncbi:hypothetical protein AAF712_003309 [Marasmius tenuissimus]|uniref:Uncharacterized protein n=1 Tax=Marasmius tenuissimus TaxID=585030 RepID=A0ABR3A6N2_9AGAR
MASSSSASPSPVVPNKITLYFYSDALNGTGPFKANQRFSVDDTSTFATILKRGFHAPGQPAAATTSTLANLKTFHVFVAPSPQKHGLVVDKLERQETSYVSVEEHLTWLLAGYVKDSRFLAFLHQRAPYLLSHHGKKLAIIFRKKTDMKLPAIQRLFSVGFDSFQIDRERHRDFDEKDYQHNRVTIENVGDAGTVQLQLFHEVLFESSRIRINKAHIRSARNGVRFHCRDPWYWRQIMKAADCFQIYDDSDEPPEDGISNQVLRTFTLDTTRLRLRAYEYTQVDHDTSTSIKGSMVQALFCEVYRRCEGYWVTEDNSARLTYILRYIGTKRAARFTPRPDTSILYSPRPIKPEDTLATFLGLLVVFCEIISNKSETDRIRLLLEAAGFLRYLRAKGLRCGRTGETLIVALYLDASLVASVYFLTMRDEPQPPIASSSRTRSYTSNRKTDPQVYIKRKDYPLSKRTAVARDPNGNRTGRTRITQESQLIQFIKLQWDLQRSLKELYADQRELVEEAVREARSLSTLLQAIPQMASASKVAKEGLNVAELYSGLRVPDGEQPRHLGSLSRPRSNQVSQEPSFQGIADSALPEEDEEDVFGFEAGSLEEDAQALEPWDSDPPSDDEELGME